jgi:hypothetical protein
MRVSASDLSVPPIAPAATPPPRSENAGVGSSPFAEVLRGLGRAIDGGEKTVRAAIESGWRGSDLGPTQLLALQASVYRYSEAIDLTSRLVDRAVGGVKAVVQGGGP